MMKKKVIWKTKEKQHKTKATDHISEQPQINIGKTKEEMWKKSAACEYTTNNNNTK